MSDIVLLLGPIVFKDFEIPAGITFGGAQRLAIHRLPGGARVIDSLGRDDANLNFAGIFTGTDATLRARGLDELRSAGLTLPLTWDVFFYRVVINSFQADYLRENWIPYRISCTVIRDEASALIQPAVSLLTSAYTDLTSALAPAASAGLDLTGAQTALAQPGAATSGSASFIAAQSSLASAQSSLAAQLSSAETSLAASGLATATTADAGVAGLAQATSASAQLGVLTQASAYTGRAAVNLANAST